MYRSKILFLVLLQILMLFNLFQCSKDNSLSSNQEVNGKFVIDELSVEASIHDNPSGSDKWCYITYTAKYHFEKNYGMINFISIAPDTLIGMVLNIDGLPSQPENIYTLQDTLVIKDELRYRDSISITYKMKGALLSEVNDEYKFTDTFEFEILKHVRIRK